MGTVSTIHIENKGNPLECSGSIDRLLKEYNEIQFTSFDIALHKMITHYNTRVDTNL